MYQLFLSNSKNVAYLEPAGISNLLERIETSRPEKSELLGRQQKKEGNDCSQASRDLVVPGIMFGA